jgi:hypothetical protein
LVERLRRRKGIGRRRIAFGLALTRLVALFRKEVACPDVSHI